MIIHDVAQNSDEWYQLRSGKVTASEFNKLITSEGKNSTQINKLIFLKVAEILAEKRLQKFGGNKSTERGHELEPEAVNSYEFIKECEVERVGFVTDDDCLYGASPDGLVNREKGVELKCPDPDTHAEYLYHNKCPSTYYIQCQGGMLLTGYSVWDFVSYHPDLPMLVVPVKRDNDLIEKLKERINYFNAEVKKRVETITNR